MPEDAKVFATHILEEVAFLRKHVAHLSLAEFSRHDALRSAATYAIQIISEAARHLPAELTENYPTVPWRHIRGTGNFTRHEYASLRMQIIWEIATVHIVELETAVLAMMQSDT